MTDNTTVSRKGIIIELSAVTALMLVVAHILYLLRNAPYIGGAVSAIVAVLFLYVPIAVLWYKKRPIDFLDRGWRRYLRSFILFVVVSAIVFPPFLVGVHGWEYFVLNHRQFHLAGFNDFLNIAAFQLVLVALPEEFFFRGYFQSAIDLICPRRWRILGVNLGWGWLITAVVFAFAHSVVYYQWWHFSIFFSALLFGYMRVRTGSITSAVFFHAASNLLMNWVSRCYS